MTLNSSIHKILESKAYDLPIPTFENFQSGFRIAVYDKKDTVIDNVVDKRLQQILKLIEEYNTISASQISKHLGITSRTVQRDLDKLKNKNLIKHIGTTKGGHWQITDNNNE